MTGKKPHIQDLFRIERIFFMFTRIGFFDHFISPFSPGPRLKRIKPLICHNFHLILFLLIFSGCDTAVTWDEAYARGQMLYRQNRYQEALPHASASLNAARNFKDIDQYRILQSLHLLAKINENLNKEETAHHFYTRCLEHIRQLRHFDSLQVYEILRNFSRFLHKKQDIRGALAVNAELLEMLRNRSDSFPPEKLGTLYYDQAVYYASYEKYQSALKFIQWAVRIIENTEGSSSPRLADPLYLLATVYYHTGEYSLGRRTAELGYRIAVEHPEISNKKKARLLMIAAKNMRQQKAVLTARERYEDALRLLDPSTGVYSPELEQIYTGLSELSVLLDERQKALSYQILAANTSEALYGKMNTNTLRQLVKLADLYRQAGDEEKALRIEYDVRQRISSLIN